MKSIINNGAIYESKGKMIESMVNNGRVIEPVITWKKDRESKKLEYRVTNKKTATFITASFFQVKKHLSKEQLRYVELYKEASHNMDKNNFSLGRWIDQLKENKKREEDDVEYYTMAEAIRGSMTIYL